MTSLLLMPTLGLAGRQSGRGSPFRLQRLLQTSMSIVVCSNGNGYPADIRAARTIGERRDAEIVNTIRFVYANGLHLPHSTQHTHTLYLRICTKSAVLLCLSESSSMPTVAPLPPSECRRSLIFATHCAARHNYSDVQVSCSDRLSTEISRLWPKS